MVRYSINIVLLMTAELKNDCKNSINLEQAGAGHQAGKAKYYALRKVSQR